MYNIKKITYIYIVFLQHAKKCIYIVFSHPVIHSQIKVVKCVHFTIRSDIRVPLLDNSVPEGSILEVRLSFC